MSALGSILGNFGGAPGSIGFDGGQNASTGPAVPKSSLMQSGLTPAPRAPQAQRPMLAPAAMQAPQLSIEAIERYRRQFGNLPVAVASASRGGNTPTSTVGSGHVGGASGSGTGGGLPRTRPSAG